LTIKHKKGIFLVQDFMDVFLEEIVRLPLKKVIKDYLLNFKWYEFEDKFPSRRRK